MVPRGDDSPAWLRDTRDSPLSQAFGEKVRTLVGHVTVIEAGRMRLVVVGGRWVTRYPRDGVSRVRGADRQTWPLVTHRVPRIGDPWEYTVRQGDREVTWRTARVTGLRQFGEDLARSPVHDDDRQGVRVRRTEVHTLWSIGDLADGMTIRIHTSGDWAGQWIVGGHVLPDCFVPDDPAPQIREFGTLWIPGNIRVDHTFWPAYEVAPRLWAPVDEAGCGSVERIVIEELE